MNDADAQLSTDGLLADLGGHSARGGALMIASDAAQVLIGLVSTLALARLLTPSDFGLVAMALSIMAFVSTFRDFGLPMATVQKRNITHVQISGLFWLNLKLAVLVAVVLVALSPAIAWFYGQAQLRMITIAMTVGIFAIGSSTVHMGLLRRQMKFGAITVVELCGVAVGSTIAIATALLGAGFWALVFQQVFSNLTIGAGLWIASRWRPGWSDRAARKELLADPDMNSMIAYGKFLTGSRVVTYVGKNIDVVLLGKFTGAVGAGLYQKAEQWAGLTFWQIYSPLSDVLVSSFSRVQHEPERYRVYFRKALMGLYLITAPAMAFALVESREMIELLGPQWLSAVPIFRAMTICTFAGSAMQVARWVFLAEGSTRRQLTWSLISTPTMIAGVAAGLAWGAIGVAWGYTAAVCLLAYPGLRFCFKGSSLGLNDFVSGFWRPALNAVIAAAALFGLRHIAPDLSNLILRLGRDGCFFSAVYAGCWLVTPGGRRDLLELLKMLRHLRVPQALGNI